MNDVKVLDKGFVRLVDYMGDDAAITQAARVSYGSGTKTVSDDETLIRYMMRNHHTSVFEQVVLKFHVKAPIFCFRQWHRHRTWSFNEISGRYSQLPDEYYVPSEDVVTFQNPNNKQGGSDEKMTAYNMKNFNEWFDCIEPDAVADTVDWGCYFQEEQKTIRQNYERWLNSGVRKELARINLPVSQYSEMYATVDLHNLFHFLKLRMDSHAQWEMREYANALFELIKPIVPVSCKAFEEYVLNAVTFSQKEIEALRVGYMIKEFPGVKDVLDIKFPNKREREEFINKVKRFTE